MVIEQKDKLSEVELQLKKAEAAQRRRMQSEKAARDAEVLPSFFFSSFDWFYNCSTIIQETVFSRVFELL